MRTYKVFVADKITKCPLLVYKVEALTKLHAKRKVAYMYRLDRTYLITALRYK
jgi:hypothetical protein